MNRHDRLRDRLRGRRDRRNRRGFDGRMHRLSGRIEQLGLLAEGNGNGLGSGRSRIAVPPVRLFLLLPRGGPDAQEKRGEEV